MVREEIRKMGDAIRQQHYRELLAGKRRLRELLSNRGPKAMKLFWKMINRKGKPSTGIEALEDEGRKNSEGKDYPDIFLQEV